MNTNGTLKYRVLQLEKSVDGMDTKVDRILENHLPHIQQELERLNTRISMFTAINVGAIIISILLHEIL